MLPPPQPPQEATDIFSISDQVLADRLQFIEEVQSFMRPVSTSLTAAFAPRSGSVTGEASGYVARRTKKSRTSSWPSSSCTAQRRRPPLLEFAHCKLPACYLLAIHLYARRWNEMKIIRALKQDPHPSIIPFHSFIITPSFAIITM